jgi:NAD(P)-dependent dehydrogenase (short-subunit alcohol dehydrogenase family)
VSARFAGRRAVVTGAAQGIGRAIAGLLASEGGRVLVLDVSGDGGRRTVDEIRAAGGEADFRLCDVGAPGDVSAAAQRVREAWGGLDFLVNNAGIFPRSGTCEMREADWDRVLRTNLSGAFHCVKHFVPLMSDRCGAVVSIASGRALQGAANGAAYSASKAGLIGLTRSLAMEFAPRGIRVNAVVPGITDTAQPRQGMTEEQIARAGDRPDHGLLQEERTRRYGNGLRQQQQHDRRHQQRGDPDHGVHSLIPVECR